MSTTNVTTRSLIITVSIQHISFPSVRTLQQTSLCSKERCLANFVVRPGGPANYRHTGLRHVYARRFGIVPQALACKCSQLFLQTLLSSHRKAIRPTQSI